MAVDIDFEAFVDKTFSVANQVSQFVDYALETELAAKLIDERILGRVVNVKAYIDKSFDQIESVKDRFDSLRSTYNDVRKVLEDVKSLSNVIRFEFQVTEDILNFIALELVKQSPYKSGNYVRNHVLFADGVLVDDVSKAPNASEYLFVNTVPYSLKIEAGSSAMAPNGVYEVVAMTAKQKYGSSIRIEYFDYIGVFGVMAQIPTASHGKRTRLQLNKAQNRFPAIRVVL